MSLGLKDLVPLYAAKLTDGAIHGADPVGIGQRAGSWFECACEEIVERGVSRRVGIFRLGHVHLITGNETLNGCCGPAPGPRPCETTCGRGQGLFGQKVLRQDGKAVRQGRFLHWGQCDGF
jgi:hypothetical protein